MRCRFANVTAILTVCAWFTIVEGRIPAGDEPAKLSDATSKLKLVPSKEVNGDEVQIRGRVLRPDGNPASAARIAVVRSVYVNRIGTWRQLVTATTKSNGAFEVAYHRSQFGKKPNEPDRRGEIFVGVEADGYAADSKELTQIDAAQPLVFKLVPDFPLRGRVIDLQGQPIAGVALSVRTIWVPSKTGLDHWLEEIKTGQTGSVFARRRAAADWIRVMMPRRDPAEPAAVTDRDGRFEIRGIAADCRVTLAIRFESIAYQWLDVVTRRMATVRAKQEGARRMPGEINSGDASCAYGADFTFVASPGRPIEGTVRDAATHKPLAGVMVEVWPRSRTAPSEMQWELQTETDENGHYRLVGARLGTGNRLFVTPNDDQPYFMRDVKVPDLRERGSNTCDVELHRGLWITGRATDKVTGKRVIASLHYLPFLSNPFVKNAPEFEQDRIPGTGFWYRTRPDGSFRVVGLPGRAIFGAQALVDRRYHTGVGAAAISGMDKEGNFPTYHDWMRAGRRWPDVMKEINPRERVAEVKCDLVFEPLETIHVSLVDSTGKPVEGATVRGAMSLEGRRSRRAEFNLFALEPGETQPVLIYQERRRLGKVLLLEHTEKTPESMTVTLEPCAILKGRIVDQDGVGVKAGVCGKPRPAGIRWAGTQPFETQSDGKFECILPPGCRYALSVVASGLRQDLEQDIAVEAGKTIDLGDVKVARMK